MTDNSMRQCAVCNSNNKKVLFHQEFAHFVSTNFITSYDVVSCQNCGFCFADNIPAQAELDVYYRELSKYEHQESDGHPTEFEVRQFPTLTSLFNGYLPNKNSRIIEIGCANGGLLNALKQSGYVNVLGVDPSPVCASNAQKLYNIPVITSSLSNLSINIGKFDFIIMVAVLEHINDLRGSLSKIKKLLSKNGLFYIEVPDTIMFLSSPDAPFQEFSIEHINYFSQISLLNLLHSVGFSNYTLIHALSKQTETKIGYELKGFFQMNNHKFKSNIIYDNESEPALISYIASSKEIDFQIQSQLDRLTQKDTPYIVWGTGTHTLRLLSSGKLNESLILAFVDSNPKYQGKLLNGKPIISPIELHHFTEPILISTRIFQNEIVHMIRIDLNLPNEIITLY